jgi:hypothetical protein
MESKDEAMGIPIDPHRQTIIDLQIFIQSYQQQGFLVYLLMDNNQVGLHVFQQQDILIKVCIPLGFKYDRNIYGSIATLIEACNLVNIYKLKYGDVPATHNGVSLQIDFDFLSYAATEFIYKCGILYFNSLFSSDHRALFVLFKQLENHNVASRIDSLVVIKITAWLPSHEETFNKIDRDFERAVKCVANSCRRNAHKKHQWTDAYSRAIYSI